MSATAGWEWLEPHFEEHTRLGEFTLLALGRSGTFNENDSKNLARQLFNLTNEVRRKHDCPSLDWEPGLAEVAFSHSRDMCTNRFFEHTNPRGQGPAERLAEFYPQYCGSSGENIFLIDSNSDIIQSDTDVNKINEQIIDGWMNSPGHRANILLPEFTHLGIGVYATEDDVYATQLFGRPLVISRKTLKTTYLPGERIALDLYLGRDFQGAQSLNIFLKPPAQQGIFARKPLPQEGAILELARKGPDFLHVVIQLAKKPGIYILCVGQGNSYYETLKFHAR